MYKDQELVTKNKAKIEAMLKKYDEFIEELKDFKENVIHSEIMELELVSDLTKWTDEDHVSDRRLWDMFNELSLSLIALDHQKWSIREQLT